ncbi:MAG: alginate export family protein [Desulfobulbaceae bacterium]|nr:alginate export family protein [Desulfobulbaceae bacterium]
MPFFLTITSILLTLFLATGPAWSDESRFTWGGDIRARIVDYDRIPTEKGTLWDETRFFRLRTRLWGQYAFTPDVAFRARLTNAWREYDSDKGVNNYQAMDEFVFDNFFMDINNLFSEKLHLRLGRQDLKYGTGKIIRIGTPLDSSRTYYFDAVKARFMFPKLTVDALGIITDNEDEFAIHRENRQLVEGKEHGAGIYVTNRHFAKIPQEYYYFFKHEDRASDLDLHTLGARFSPKFTKQFSANMEVAVQDGSRDNGNDIEGQLFDLSLFYKLPESVSFKPVMDLSYYYLSGDDKNTGTEEGWHPLWARFPQYMSYTIVRALVPNFAAWSNISMPSIGLKANIGSHFTLRLRVAKVYAPEKGLEDGEEKGDLYISRLTYKINDHWDGNIHLEAMDPGNYYAAVNHTAHYAHLQLMYHF